MADKEHKFTSSLKLVPVRAVLPEDKPGEGAIVIMRDGTFRMIIHTGSVNFDMKSPYEQAAITYTFGGLVNSLPVDFPIQIVSHSRMLDVDSYTHQFDARLQNDRTPTQIRRLIAAHQEHFRGQVRTDNMLQRHIYVVIPYGKGVGHPMQRSVTDELPLASIFKTVMSSAERRLMDFEPSDLDIAVARQQLDRRANQISERLGDMKIWSRRLDEPALIDLLYEIYHPDLSERQRHAGYQAGGSLAVGFSAPQGPMPRQRVTDGKLLQPPEFSQ